MTGCAGSRRGVQGLSNDFCGRFGCAQFPCEMAFHPSGFQPMTTDPRIVYEFGPFRMDPEKQILLRENQPIPVTPKAFETLLVLVRRSRDVVSKEELLKEIWPDSFVEESNLTQNIFMLRKALGDTAENRQYIVTLPGRGYRFAALVRTVTEEGEVLVAQARARTQIVIEENEPETDQALKPLPIPQRPGVSRKFLLAMGAVAVLLALGAFLLIRSRVPAALGTAGKDSILVADFVNTTGDPVFDDTLRQGLAIQLEQSPFLKIMDDDQMQRVLRRMSLSPAARVTNPVAHEICVREGAAATIDGAIASLGRNYVITLEATRCKDGATLAREQIQAADKEHVLNALGTAATDMRGKLGESLDSIERPDRPPEQATTASLEALQSYTAGHAEMEKSQTLAAIASFERAIQIDPSFAIAYYHLGVAYDNIGDMASSRKFAKEAFRLSDHVSEYERAQIVFSYYRATGEVYKEIDALQLGIRNYPRRWEFPNNLGLVYVDLGRYDEGLKWGLEGTRVQPNIEPPYRRQLDAYICLDRLAEARKLAEKLRAQGLDGVRIHQRFLEMAYVEQDQAAISREIQWFAGKPEEFLSFGLQAADRNVHGQRRESHKLYQRAAETASRLGLRDAAAEFEEADARADALSGNCSTARRLGRPALALAMCGDAAAADKLAAETSKLFPDGTIWTAVQLPEIRAAIALNRDQPDRSVELLASASPYERSYLEASYLRGLAYLRLHKGMEATAEFQKIVDHKGANWGATWVHPNWGQYYSLSYLGLARGFALTGDMVKARKAFQDFLELWKDADPDCPILQRAKAEFGKLR
jgi:DNA-binding winged helix-turn-helix (wHTH) protein